MAKDGAKEGAKDERAVSQAALLPKPRSRRRWPMALATILLLLVAAVWLAPVVAGRTGLRDWALNAALPIEGRVSAGSASLGWFSPIVVENVELVDAKQQPVAQASRIATERTLLALALDATRVGKIQIDKPVLHLALREGGSNLEDALAPLLNSPKAEAPVEIDCQVTGGVIHIRDLVAKRDYDVNAFALHLAWPSSGELPIVCETSGSLPAAGAGAGFDVAAQVHMPAEQDAGLVLDKLESRIQGAPLEMLQPLVRRFLIGAQLTGTLTSNLACSTSPDAGQISLAGTIDVARLDLVADALGKDRLQLARMQIPCRLAQAAGVVNIEQLGIDCDLGKLNLEGRVKLADLSRESLRGILEHDAYRLAGQLDLAALARLLPGTLNVREGTEVTGGQVQLELAGKPAKDGQSWSGRIEAANLTATNAGRQVQWQQPVIIEGVAYQSPSGLVVQRLHCESNFLRADAAGQASDVQGNLAFDLDQLVSQLEQFIDLGELRMAGRGEGNWRFQRGQENQFTADAKLVAQNFRLNVPGKRPWDEPSLTATLAAAGSLDEQSLRRLDRASLVVETARDRSTVELAQAINDFKNAPLPFKIDWQGELAAWLPRLQPWMDAKDLQLAGNGSLQALATYAASGWEVSKATLDAQQLQVRSGDTLINEPRVTLAGDCRYQKKEDLLTIPGVTLTSQAAQVNVAGKVSALSTTCDLDLAGKLDYDWQQLAPIYRAYLGSSVEITGRGSRPFSLRGPWTFGAPTFIGSLAKINGQAGVGWDAMNLYGLQVGPAEIATQLSGGALRTTPLELDVSEGRINLAPFVRLEPAPAELQLPKGQLVRQVRITPELCARGLKFVAPILAEATVAEGRFSIDLDGVRLPLEDMKKGDAAGRFIVHSVQVKPGPLANELILLGRQLAAVLARCRAPTDAGGGTLLTIKDQSVDFQMADGRVHHRNLEFMAGEVPVRTQGSVGLDESLSIIAEIPVQDAWVSKEPALAGLQGKTLQIPIEGTLQQPRIDRRALDKLAGQLLENAARGAIINQLDKQLDKLLPFKR